MSAAPSSPVESGVVTRPVEGTFEDAFVDAVLPEPATVTTPGGVTIPASVCLTCADQWFECPDCGGRRHRSTEQDGQR